jgi:hypothetical protein
MPNIPNPPKNEQIVWFENHISAWQAAPTSYGTNAAAVSNLASAIVAARAAYNNAQLAKQNAKNAVVGQDEQVANMLAIGRDLVNVMKSFIENSNNPALWAQAGLVPDADPGTAPDPVAPYQLNANLDSQGNVIVKWKTSQPAGVSGVIYSVRRSVDMGQGDGGYVLLDSVGGKEFIDTTVPVGAASVSYAVQAKRGNQTSGWSEALTVKFGRASGSGSGSFSITSTQTTPANGVRIAA